MPKKFAKHRRLIGHAGVLGALVIASLSSGCAMIFSGTEQTLQVKPKGARIEIYTWDGKQVTSSETASEGGLTVHRPPRGESYLVILQKDGYCPKYWVTPLAHEQSTVARFMLFLEELMFPIGWFGKDVDHFSGAPYTFKPTEFELTTQDTLPCGS
jgi:hypothetical protein